MGRRCTECRKSFVAAPSAKTSQRVCSLACRKARDRSQARARRRRELEAARAEERLRQRACRERRASCEGGHAGPSSPKRSISRMEMGLVVDRLLALSRASLMRDLPRILRAMVGDPWRSPHPVTQEPPGTSAGADS